MEKKQAAFAGSWYPASAKACETAIQGFLRDSSHGQDLPKGTPMGGIVPHAGWTYSGSIACRTIEALVPGATEKPVDTILLFGGHVHHQSEHFIMTHGAVETPWGDIEIDQEMVEAIVSGVGIRERSPKKFPEENTLELQYPFIKHFFPGAKLVVCGVPPSGMTPVIASMAIEASRGLSREIRVIGSTDMTHYGPDFGFSPAGTGRAAVEWVERENDARAIEALSGMDVSQIISQGLENKNMCCAGAAAAAAAACKKMGAAKGTCLDYATSYELSRADSFVGYCGMVFLRS